MGIHEGLFEKASTNQDIEKKVYHIWAGKLSFEKVFIMKSQSAVLFEELLQRKM